MLRHRFHRFLLSLMAIMIVWGMLSPSFAAEKVERVAKLTALVGDVKVKKAGGAKPFKAFTNMPVAKGDQVITGKNSSVQLLLDDGSKLMIGSNAVSMISDLVKTAAGGNKTAVKVVSGQVWSKLQSLSNANDSFKFETPTAVMGIRGTMLLIEGERVWVTEGAVSVKGTGESGQEALVLANEQAQASPNGTLAGEVIDPADLARQFDRMLLREAVNDIVDAIYEAAQNPNGSQVGKNISNDFLSQASEFVETAQQEDPTIEVPEDFEQVVETVTELVEEQKSNPNNPNPSNTITGEADTTNSGNSPQPGTGNTGTGGNSGGGGNNEGGNDGRGGDGGGVNPPSIDSVTAAPIGNGEFSLVKVSAVNTAFRTKQLIINIDDSQWGDEPVVIRNVRAASNTEVEFEVSTPDDGSYQLSFLYDGNAFTKTVAFRGAPEVIKSVTVETDEAKNVTLHIKGRNLKLQPNSFSLTLTGGPDNVSYALENPQYQNKNNVTASVPRKIKTGAYTLTLQSSGKTYTYGPFEINVNATVETVTVTPANEEMVVGETRHFTATATYTDGKTVDVTSEATWSVEHPELATVGAGKVYAANSGTTKVKAAFGGKDGTASLSIKPNVVSAPLLLASAAQGSLSGTIKVTAQVEPTNHLVVQVLSEAIPTPNVGDAPPTNISYTNGTEFGVNRTGAKYVAVYEVDSSNKIKKFKLIELTGEIIASNTAVLNQAAYAKGYKMLVLTGSGLSQISKENAEIKQQLDWSRIIVAINPVGTSHSEGSEVKVVSFERSDIASAKVLNDQTLLVQLTEEKGNALNERLHQLISPNDQLTNSWVHVDYAFLLDPGANPSTGFEAVDDDLQSELAGAQAVAADKIGLSIGYAEGDSAEHVTQNLSLPDSGEFGSNIDWQSNNHEVIAIDGGTGYVTATASDQTVNLSAIISKDSASDVRTFSVIVKAERTESRTISGTLYLPDGAVAPPDGLTVTLTAFTAEGSGSGKIVTIPAGSDSVPYALEVDPNGAESGYRVGYFVDFDRELKLVQNAFYLSGAGASTNWDEAAVIDVSGADATGKDIIMLTGKLIAGVVSLPGDDTAPDNSTGGIWVKVLATNESGKAGWTEVKIETGSSSIPYELVVPADNGYLVSYLIDDRYNQIEYQDIGFYSTSGTTADPSQATHLAVSEDQSGIMLTLLEPGVGGQTETPQVDAIYTISAEITGKAEVGSSVTAVLDYVEGEEVVGTVTADDYGNFSIPIPEEIQYLFDVGEELYVFAIADGKTASNYAWKQVRNRRAPIFITHLGDSLADHVFNLEDAAKDDEQFQVVLPQNSGSPEIDYRAGDLVYVQAGSIAYIDPYRITEDDLAILNEGTLTVTFDAYGYYNVAEENGYEDLYDVHAWVSDEYYDSEYIETDPILIDAEKPYVEPAAISLVPTGGQVDIWFSERLRDGSIAAIEEAIRAKASHPENLEFSWSVQWPVLTIAEATEEDWFPHILTVSNSNSETAVTFSGDVTADLQDNSGNMNPMLTIIDVFSSDGLLLNRTPFEVKDVYGTSALVDGNRGTYATFEPAYGDSAHVKYDLGGAYNVNQYLLDGYGVYVQFLKPDGGYITSVTTETGGEYADVNISNVGQVVVITSYNSRTYVNEVDIIGTPMPSAPSAPTISLGSGTSIDVNIIEGTTAKLYYDLDGTFVDTELVPSVAGTTASFDYASLSLSPGTYYFYATQTLNGVESAKSETLSVTIEEALASAPELLSSIPADNGVDTGTEQDLVLTFSESVLISDESLITLKESVSGTSVSIDVYGTETDTLTIKHDPLSTNTQYTLTIGAGALVNAGEETNGDITISFTTGENPAGTASAANLESSMKVFMQSNRSGQTTLRAADPPPY